MQEVILLLDDWWLPWVIHSLNTGMLDEISWHSAFLRTFLGILEVYNTYIWKNYNAYVKNQLSQIHTKLFEHLNLKICIHDLLHALLYIFSILKMF